MPDDKSNVGEPDSSRIAADYEVSHHAETLSISSDEGPVGTTVKIGNGGTTNGGRRMGPAATPSLTQRRSGLLCASKTDLNSSLVSLRTLTISRGRCLFTLDVVSISSPHAPHPSRCRSRLIRPGACPLGRDAYPPW